MKLELKHLAPYLPYDLNIWANEKLQFSEFLDTKKEQHTYEMGAISMMAVMRGVDKPILRPLSDLMKPEYDDFKHKYNLRAIEDWLDCKPASWSYECAVRLFEMHFDIFGLIDEGLAMDRNQL